MDQFSDFIGGLVGAGIALVFEFFPPAKRWFDTLSSRQRAAVIAALTTLAALVIAWAGCNGYKTGAPVIECAGGGWWLEALRVAFVALTGGQVAHRLTKDNGQK